MSNLGQELVSATFALQQKLHTSGASDEIKGAAQKVATLAREMALRLDQTKSLETQLQAKHEETQSLGEEVSKYKTALKILRRRYDLDAGLIIWFITTVLLMIPVMQYFTANGTRPLKWWTFATTLLITAFASWAVHFWPAVKRVRIIGRVARRSRPSA